MRCLQVIRVAAMAKGLAATLVDNADAVLVRPLGPSTWAVQWSSLRHRPMIAMDNSSEDIG